MDLTKTPDDLPIPQDDGSARHLVGTTLPSLSLLSTNGNQIDLVAYTEYDVDHCECAGLDYIGISMSLAHGSDPRPRGLYTG